MPFGMLYLKLFSELEIFEILSRKFWKKNQKKPIWVEARELEFSMNMF
jgi:hypothetical protein